MLAIFLKYPVEGQVKTRIAIDSSKAIATKVYRYLTEDVVNQLAQLKPTLHYSGCSLQEMQKWLPSHSYELQSQGDLGQRLINCSQKHFEKTNEPLIIIGTDCPTIDRKIIEEANQRLEESDFVVGPTNDGGYYLIGMKRHLPELFEDIDWSTEKVFEQTLKQGQKYNLRYQALIYKEDIDHWHQVPEKYKNLAGLK